MKAVITDTEIRNPDIEIGILRSAGFSVEVAQCRSADEVVEAAANAEAILVQYAPVTAEAFSALPKLRIVSRYGIGVDSIDIEAARKRGVWVSNVPEYGSDEVPSHTLAMMFALMRHLPFHDRNIRNGKWDFQATGDIKSFSEIVLGIVGMGRIGRHVARLARPFVGKIIAYDPYLERWPDDIEQRTLQALFAESDAISLHLPLTADTRAIVNSDLLAHIGQSGAYLVNSSRGGLVDLDAVLDALQSGRLKGVAVDVMPTEPPSMDHPILHHPRTLVSPHAAWYSTASIVDLRTKYARNIAIWAETGKAPNAVCIGT